jgi:ribosomal protein S18 acetylase RimI-like enzyme
MIVIREIEHHELIEVQKLAHAIWPVVYADMISKEQIDYMLNWMYSIDALEKQVSEGCIFLIAQHDDRFLGFASYGPGESGRYKLHKLYVMAHLHGMGVGKLLLQEVCAALQNHGVDEIELQVNKRNKAVGFYRSQGFTVEAEKVFDIGNGFVMDDFIMVKKLK